MKGLAGALFGERGVLPGLHIGGLRQRQAAREDARDDAGLGFGEGKRDDAVGQADDGEGGRGVVEKLVVEVLGATAVGDEGRVQAGEEREGVHVAGAEDDAVDVVFDVAVGEADGSVGDEEGGDFGEAEVGWVGGVEVGGFALGDEDGVLADGDDLVGYVHP